MVVFFQPTFVTEGGFCFLNKGAFMKIFIPSFGGRSFKTILLTLCAGWSIFLLASSALSQTCQDAILPPGVCLQDCVVRTAEDLEVCQPDQNLIIAGPGLIEISFSIINHCSITVLEEATITWFSPDPTLPAQFIMAASKNIKNNGTLSAGAGSFDICAGGTIENGGLVVISAAGNYGVSADGTITYGGVTSVPNGNMSVSSTGGDVSILKAVIGGGAPGDPNPHSVFIGAPGGRSGAEESSIDADDLTIVAGKIKINDTAVTGKNVTMFSNTDLEADTFTLLVSSKIEWTALKDTTTAQSSYEAETLDLASSRIILKPPRNTKQKPVRIKVDSMKVTAVTYSGDNANISANICDIDVSGGSTGTTSEAGGTTC